MKTHYFCKDKSNAVLCWVKPMDNNWYRGNYCTRIKKLVTCKNCLRLLK